MKKLKIIGKLTTERYMSFDSIVEKRKFRVLKRMSNGNVNDIIQDPEYDIGRIDFSLYDDGLYELGVDNISIDIETGYADDWDLVLIKVSEQQNEQTKK